MTDLPDEKVYCHRTGFKKQCRKLVVSGACKRWIQIQGSNPNTGEGVNRSDCVDNWGPMLMIENSQQQRQTAAAVESFRNKMVEYNNVVLATLQGVLDRALPAPLQELTPIDGEQLPGAEPLQLPAPGGET